MRFPDWDIDRSYGEAGEQSFRRLMGLDRERFEVKRKRYRDDKFYVETHQLIRGASKYVPSGINTTRAEYWAYMIADTGVTVLFPTAALRSAARSAETVSEDDGDNPTRGRLVSLQSVVEFQTRVAAA